MESGSGAASPHHPNTSGHRSRPMSRNDTRYEKRRVTERTYETHIERVRTTSPGKRKARSSGSGVEKRSKSPSLSSDLAAAAAAAAATLAPWMPEARLLPHTSAPLATRVSLPPLASTVPQAPQPRPLSELSLKQQEAAMIEDLLYVLMGYEGSYIRYAAGYNANEERDGLAGPTFSILPGLDASLHDLTQSMLAMATYYSSLVAFCQVQGQDHFGTVNHALCASMRRFLHDYIVLVVQLERQFRTKDNFTLYMVKVHTIPTKHMMQQLYSLAQELLKKSGLLDEDSGEDSGDNDDDDDDADDYDRVIERLADGGDLLAGSMAGGKLCKGGVVLGMLTRRLEMTSGDAAARALLTTLLRDASRPYMVMLNEWLHHGAIKDAHAEFLIKEQRSIRRERLEQDYTDEYWERRYTVRDDEVPPQLAGVKDKVLLAGKYLNVVRECGGVDVTKAVADVPQTIDDGGFLDNVQVAYAHANRSLMQLLVTTHALPARLRSIKRYFFLDPSDYLSYFLELGASELRKPVRAVNTPKLQSLLDVVLRQPGSLVALDPFKEDVKVEMNEVTLVRSLQRVVNITGIEHVDATAAASAQPADDRKVTGFSSLQLDYAVPFPVSLVISRKTVWRYQALFRYLVSLRHLEAQLSATWQTQTRSVTWSHRGPNRALEIWKRRAWTLRARMQGFVQQLLYFCTNEVIGPNWTRFMATLNPPASASAAAAAAAAAHQPVRTVDQLMQDHVDFLDTCLKECMLTNSKLLRIHAKLMQTCTMFAAYTNWLTRELEKVDPHLSSSNRPDTMTRDQWRRFQATKRASTLNPDDSATGSATTEPPSIGNLSEIIRKWESNFSRHLQILLDALNHYAATETIVLLSLCARLSTANQGTDYAGPRLDDEGPSGL